MAKLVNCVDTRSIFFNMQAQHIPRSSEPDRRELLTLYENEAENKIFFTIRVAQN